MSIATHVARFDHATPFVPPTSLDLCDRGSAVHAARLRLDTRYRDLLSPVDWAQLPLVVQQRFSRHLAPGETKLFTGAVVKTELSPLGRIMALVLRPLNIIPAHHGSTGPSTVVVTEGAAGQTYDRVYGRQHGTAQVISTTKCFRASGLAEELGHGLAMRLSISVEERALVFRSLSYQWTAFGRTVTLPRWLSPGRARIEHADIDGRRFRFTLTLEHPWLGRLVEQVAEYVDAG
jgi:hypothetical protein